MPLPGPEMAADRRLSCFPYDYLGALFAFLNGPIDGNAFNVGYAVASAAIA